MMGIVTWVTAPANSPAAGCRTQHLVTGRWIPIRQETPTRRWGYRRLIKALIQAISTWGMIIPRSVTRLFTKEIFLILTGALQRVIRHYLTEGMTIPRSVTRQI